METQVETSLRKREKNENAMERFIRKTRTLFAQEPDLDRRWNALRPVLAELLADPEVIQAARHWPDCVPANGRAENLLFYEDPDSPKERRATVRRRAFTIMRISTRFTACSTAASGSYAMSASTIARSRSVPKSAKAATCLSARAKSIW